jgi:TPR repeat protein
LAANQGHAPSQRVLGLKLVKGDGVTKNIEEGVKFFRQAAERGDAGGNYNLGVAYELGHIPLENDADVNNLEVAIKLFHLAAEKGYVHAQIKLGEMSAYGVGMAVDLDEAVKWFRLAADKGDNMSAQYNLGLLFINEQYSGYNLGAAIDWFRLAARQGHVNAQFLCGVSTISFPALAPKPGRGGQMGAPGR